MRAEDLSIGQIIDLGEHRVSREEIVDFASKWDPQPFHLDADFAATTRFGELIGSGLHTMAIYQRLAVLGAYRHWAIIAGRRIREVGFTKPLRPGTTVRATVVVDTVTPESADRSLVRKTGRVLQGDHVLMTLKIDVYVLRRPTAGEAFPH